MQHKELKSLVDIEHDIITHPESDLEYLNELFQSDLLTKSEIEDIETALSLLLKDETLTETKKAELLNDSWKINYKFKVPTIEEFLTEKWIGPQAQDLYPHCRKTIIDYFNPLVNRNKLILYCCTG